MKKANYDKTINCHATICLHSFFACNDDKILLLCGGGLGVGIVIASAIHCAWQSINLNLQDNAFLWFYGFLIVDYHADFDKSARNDEKRHKLPRVA